MRVDEDGESEVYYLHGDHLGSTSLTTDKSGAMVARQLYHPYGTTRYSEGTLATDFGFTGQRSVAGTGLVFMHARFYDPALGRFVSADTIVPDPGNPQSLNRYSYVYNRPLVYIDPDGHIGIVAIVGLIALSVAVLSLTSDVSPPPGSPLADSRAGNQVVGEYAMVTAMTCGLGVLVAPGASGAIGTVAVAELATAELADQDNDEVRFLQTLGEAGTKAIEGMSADGDPGNELSALGDIVKTGDVDSHADALAQRLGGQSSVTFVDDPLRREFDAVSNEFIGQVTRRTVLGSAFRNQAKATFETASTTGRQVYYRFLATPSQAITDKLHEYAARYNVGLVIEVVDEN
ncbi:MAG: hypothetical protein GY833_09700 [Aestuariibacter sp.]|nr:hypothetical protein [Aestuariibacter sp.]